GLMIAVTSFIGVPWLERLADREHDRALAGVLRLTAAGIEEAVRLDGCAATAFRVGVYVRESEHPAAEVLGDAELPVVVARVAEVLDIEMPEVADQTPAAAEIPGSAQVDVARILGIGGGEVVVDRPELLEAEKHPRAADIDLLVVHLAARDGAGGEVRGGANKSRARGVGSRVVVVDEAGV